jgi:hypothetical protein
MMSDGIVVLSNGCGIICALAALAIIIGLLI